MIWRWAVFIGLVLGPASVLQAQVKDIRASTFVIYNRAVPESRALAKYYAEKRGIPFRQVLGLVCSIEEEISRSEYLSTIQKPLEGAFTQQKWWVVRPTPNLGDAVEASQMRYLVIMRGIPLKVRADPTLPAAAAQAEVPSDHAIQQLFRSNESSVDSELAAFFDLRNEYPGIVPNPYFKRFSTIFDVPPSASPLLVGRLDGPTGEVVRLMIDAALETEKRGLWGWAVIDARGITSGPYLEGDKWLREAADFLRKQGVPVLFDDFEEILPTGFPMPETAVYYGWYAGNVAGPFAEPSFRFQTGAVAAHIHSFSASTLRSPTSGWSGPLLLRGAAVTLGNVYEPYLGLTTNLDVFQDRLMAGFTVGESAYMAVMGLSWMNIVLGDPLYRPYARWKGMPGKENPKDQAFIDYRKAVLAAGGRVVAAAPALRSLARASGNSMFLEGLSDAQMAGGDATAALASLDAALALETRPSVRFRLTWQKIGILRRKKDLPAAIRLISKALGDFRDPAQRSILDAILLKIQPPPPPQPVP
jgi:uncharacterized protein (TIGR03790 family)